MSSTQTPAESNVDAYAKQPILKDLVEDATGWLYHTANFDSDLRVNWEEGDVRATSLAVVVLHELGDPPDSALLDGALKWLEDHLQEQKYEGKVVGRGWAAEIWDTSWALLAFKLVRGTSPDYVEKWMHYVRQLNRNSNWHDEAWETCLAARALIERPVGDLSWLPAAVLWLNQLIKPARHGQVSLGFHYTALYLSFLAEIERLSREVASPLLRDLHQETRANRLECEAFLLNALRERPGEIWSGEVWCNAYCLLASLENQAFAPEDEDKCIEWFETHYRAAYSDALDNALTAQALHRLYVRREVRRQLAEVEMNPSDPCIVEALKSATSAKLRRGFKVKEFLIVPPRFHTSRPDGSLVFYFSTQLQKRIRWALATAVSVTTVTLGILSVVFKWFS